MITAEKLRELVHYDPDSGVFTRLKRTSNSTNIGDIVGSVNAGGYIEMSVGGKRSYGHRLAFLWMTGEMPPLVDHINGVRTDNRWVNLRWADDALNSENRRNCPQRNNPLLGASWHKGAQKWVSAIKVRGVPRYLGLFATPEEAHQVYLNAKRELHVGCTI